MKALFIVSLLMIPFMANAAVTPTTHIVTTSYVQGAYDELDGNKQDKLSPSNVTESGSGVIVTSVAASNGTVTVTKSEVSIPSGSANSTTRASIWLQ